MFNDSCDPKGWYFFASAGLNVTAKVLTTLNESHKFDALILDNFDLLKKYREFKKIKDYSDTVEETKDPAEEDEKMREIT